ncbi:MAG: porin family protein [Desulfosudis oleivorans]|nr:porin family protein [Desulfosudis oleivorans]
MTLVLTILAVGAMHASVAVAEENTTIHRSSRSGDMEFSLADNLYGFFHDQRLGGSSVDLNADWSPGFGIGYHINEHVLVNGLFTWSSRGYDAETVLENGSTGNYNGTLDSSTISLNGTYFILDRDITPFVSGGIGWTYLDTNIPSGPSEALLLLGPVVGLRVHLVCAHQVRQRVQFQCRSWHEVGHNAEFLPAGQLQQDVDRCQRGLRRHAGLQRL